VDDLEEFHAKLDQIGSDNTKGTVACRNGFQESALKYAQSKGIGLVRMRPQGSVVVLMEMASPPREPALVGLIQPSTWRGFTRLFYGLSCCGEDVSSLEQLIAEEMR